MVNYSHTFRPCCLAIIFLLSYFTPIEAHINGGGFTINLIRKNTNIAPNTAQSPVSTYRYKYQMELFIGTPPVKIYGEVDTGSDLIWTQCVPCNKCYKQLNPLFDPRKSSTYTNVSCHSKPCHKLDSVLRGCSPHKLCNYTYPYGSYDSVAQGFLARETITFPSTTGKPVSLKGIIFGCGHNDTGDFNDHEMGLVGLGGGPLSLISQIGSSLGGRKYFSQCLVPFGTDFNVSSKMSFGKGSEVLGDGVVSTPLITNKEIKTPRNVNLLGISVEDTYLPLINATSNSSSAKANMMIDSGTAQTILPQQLYDGVVDQLRKRIPLKPISDDPRIGNALCYRTKPKGPTLTIHFEGADVLLTPTQFFAPPVPVELADIYCLAFTRSVSSNFGIYGNFAQSNYLIGFDLDRQVVSFKPTDCTKY